MSLLAKIGIATVHACIASRTPANSPGGAEGSPRIEMTHAPLNNSLSNSIGLRSGTYSARTWQQSTVQAREHSAAAQMQECSAQPASHGERSSHLPVLMCTRPWSAPETVKSGSCRGRSSTGLSGQSSKSAAVGGSCTADGRLCVRERSLQASRCISEKSTQLGYAVIS